MCSNGSSLEYSGFYGVAIGVVSARDWGIFHDPSCWEFTYPLPSWYLKAYDLSYFPLHLEMCSNGSSLEYSGFYGVAIGVVSARDCGIFHDPSCYELT